jgi:nucleotide-binding universal stress UspA family protein
MTATRLSTTERDGTPVLLALDGRADAAGAIRVAEALCRRHGNDIHVTTVLEPLPPYLTGMDLYPDERATNRIARAREDVGRRIQSVLGREYEWPVEVVGGHVPDALAAAAGHDHVAAVVIGIGQHHTVERILGGETSLHIAARSTVPVIAVPEWVTTLPHNAVVGTDFGDASLAATQAALDCLAAPGVLTLLHVALAFDPLLTGGHEGLSYRDAVSDLFASMIDQLEVPPGIEIKTARLSGSPAEGMIAYAKRIDADLMSVGTHGTGTVASELLRAERYMVIVAPARRD